MALERTYYKELTCLYQILGQYKWQQTSSRGKNNRWDSVFTPESLEQQGIDISSDGRTENAKTVAHYWLRGNNRGCRRKQTNKCCWTSRGKQRIRVQDLGYNGAFTSFLVCELLANSPRKKKQSTEQHSSLFGLLMPTIHFTKLLCVHSDK